MYACMFSISISMLSEVYAAELGHAWVFDSVHSSWTQPTRHRNLPSPTMTGHELQGPKVQVGPKWGSQNGNFTA